ncbi:MAG: serine hydrolase domain-containing protein [Planctomycetota bacterium]
MTAPRPERPERPSPAWPTAAPADVGVDRDVLDGDLVELLGSNKTNAAALVVGGKLVWEHYWNGHGPTSRFNTFSVAKGFACACIGLLNDDGKLSVDDPACKYLPEWAGDARRAITIRHLLTMTSGLKLDYHGFYAEPDSTAAALRWPLEHPPGTVCCYEQATAAALSPIVKRITGMQPLDFLRARILDPIGAHEIDWEATPHGDSLTWRSILASARDLARFGWFLHRGGIWDGRQLLSADWIRRMTTHEAWLDGLPSGGGEKPFRRMNWGWMCFVNAHGIWPGVGADCFSLSGAYGNKCLVDKQHDFVFTRLVTPAGVARQDYPPYANDLDSTDRGTPRIWQAVLKAFR